MKSIKLVGRKGGRLILITFFKLWLAGSICFILSRSTPGDPLEQYLGYPAENKFIGEQADWESEMQRYRSEYHLDRPLFYLSLASGYPDFIYNLPSTKLQMHLRMYFDAYRNEAQVKTYYQGLLQLKSSIAQIPDRTTKNILENKWNYILLSQNVKLATKEFDALISQLGINGYGTFRHIQWQKELQNTWLYCWPQIRWYGLDNQYHHWMIDVLTGRWGRSLIDGETVRSKILPALRWTVGLTLPALFLALMIAVITGMRSGLRSNKRQWSDLVSLLLFAIPVFALATALIQLFTKAGLFPVFSSVVRPVSEINFWSMAYYYSLPIFCLTAGLWAFLHQQLSAQIQKTNQASYVAAARFRGVSPSVVKWQYIFPNSIYPLITTLAVMVPGLLAGALAVEIIFDVPGMGKLLYSSLLGKDWPVVFVLIFLNMGLIILVNMLADWIYLRYDPRKEQLKLNQVI